MTTDARSQEATMYDDLILGAGWGGLSLAALLATFSSGIDAFEAALRDAIGKHDLAELIHYVAAVPGIDRIRAEAPDADHGVLRVGVHVGIGCERQVDPDGGELTAARPSTFHEPASSAVPRASARPGIQKRLPIPTINTPISGLPRSSPTAGHTACSTTPM